MFCLQAMIQGLLDMYELMTDKFKCTPSRAHYVFTQHDISRVVEGILLLSPRKTKSKPRRNRAKKENGKLSPSVFMLFISFRFFVV